VATIARSHIIVLQLRRCVPGIGSNKAGDALELGGVWDGRSCVFRHVTSSDQSAGVIMKLVFAE
jgi:hypothetical protein